MLIRWQDKELTLPPGTSVRDCLAALGISEGALAAMRGGQVLVCGQRGPERKAAASICVMTIRR